VVQAPFYFIFRQDGNKLSGSGGPSEKEQIVSFENGVVDDDRIAFEMRNEEDTLKVVLKRVEALPKGVQKPEAFCWRNGSPDVCAGGGKERVEAQGSGVRP
jgi:hypothetical protein